MKITWFAFFFLAIVSFNVFLLCNDFLLERKIFNINRKHKEDAGSFSRSAREAMIAEIEDRHKSEYRSFEVLARQLAEERNKTIEVKKKLNTSR